jgi:hypothetical protein
VSLWWCIVICGDMLLGLMVLCCILEWHYIEQVWVHVCWTPRTLQCCWTNGPFCVYRSGLYNIVCPLSGVRC